tara:strand:- start:83 stop:475 length:393 start_codon:yes stop_codon:yes gene_type:complete
MGVTLTTVLGDLAGKCVVDLAADTTAESNVTAAAGSVFLVEIDATAGVATTSEPACYVKMFNSSGTTTGGGNSSSIPELVFYAPIGQKTTYVIPGGWAFGAGLGVWAVTTAALTGDASPTADVKVTILSS